MSSPVSAVLSVLHDVVDLLDGGDCAISPEACRVAVYPGLEVAWDTCGEGGCSGKDGQLWAALVGINPTATGSTDGRCASYVWTAEIGVVRCAKGTVRDDGSMPSVGSVEADSTQQAADADAVWNALRCCADRPESLRDVELTQWRPLGPNGGCVGGAWTVRGVINVCC